MTGDVDEAVRVLTRLHLAESRLKQKEDSESAAEMQAALKVAMEYLSRRGWTTK